MVKSIYFREEILKAVEELAKRERRSLSAMVNLLLERALKDEHEKRVGEAKEIRT